MDTFAFEAQYLKKHECHYITIKTGFQIFDINCLNLIQLIWYVKNLWIQILTEILCNIKFL
jgi:hypothetical protein